MEYLEKISGVLWAPLVYILLALGVFLTLATKGLQVRRLPEMLRILKQSISEKTEGAAGISSFQAFTLTLSSRIGVGNVAGIATAVAYGGPGALFWMATVAFLGGTTAFVESTLAQIYKQKVNGEYRGGIPYYVEKGLGSKKLAVGVALVAISLYAIFAPGIQSNTIASSFQTAFDFSPIYTGLGVVVVLGYIVFGNRDRIVKYVECIVPFMATSYILMAIAILACNVEAIPEAIRLIVSSAFGSDAVFGGLVGSSIAWGVKRAIMANGAGMGEGTFGAGAAEVSHPAKQGFVQCFSIYIDTLLVCMSTGVMIVVTGKFNVFGTDGTLIRNVIDSPPGAGFTLAAINSSFPSVGAVFLAVTIACFAFTTMVAYYYICETNMYYVLKKTNKPALFVVKIIFLSMVFFGAIKPAAFAWALADVGYGVIAWINIICLTLLMGPALRTMQDYDRQLKAGKEPVFDPVKLRIKNADFWMPVPNKQKEKKRSGTQSTDSRPACTNR